MFNRILIELKDSEKCGVRIVKCGREKCLSYKAVETGPKKTFAIHLVDKGEGVFSISGKKHILKAGDIFVLLPNVKYAYYPSYSNPWSYYWVELESDGFEVILTRMGLLAAEPYCKPKNMTVLKNHFSELIRLYGNDIQKNSLDLYGELLKLLAELFRQTKFDISGTGNDLTGTIKESIYYINCNFRVKLTLDDIASNALLSKSHLLNSFRDKLGISPIEYLNLYRICRSCDLLKTKQYSIAEVAAMCGFDDSRYFARQFLQIKGVTPREYVKTQAEDDNWSLFRSKGIYMEDI